MNIIINGANGKAGKALFELSKTKEDIHVSALVDPTFETNAKEGIFKRIFETDEKADAIIDFSFHSCVPVLCAYAAKTKTPLVIATTGHTEKEKSIIVSTSNQIPVFYSANMSLGVLLTIKIAKAAAETFPEAEIDIVETHHDKKADMPSGTALMLAEAIRSVRPKLKIRCGQSFCGERKQNDLFIHSLRLGNSVGTHEIIFSLPFQTVTIKHEAHDRRIFAQGALLAAEFLQSKRKGLFSDFSSV